MKLLVLKIVSVLYGWGSKLRNKLYDSGWLKIYTVKLPVICVGNITAGGNSKTPLVAFICQELAQRGFMPAVLTRGYGGQVRGPHLVSTIDNVSAVSDEALMLARSLSFPVIISADRVHGAEYIESNKLGNVIVMDDGFQHRRLARNLDIIAVNATSTDDLDEFIAGELLPVGRFREDLLAGLTRASIVVFVNRSTRMPSNDLPARVLALIPDTKQVYRGQLFADQPSSVFPNEHKLESGTKVVAFCAIANPEGFFSSIDAQGFKVCARLAYSDHHVYSWAEIKDIQARYPDIPLICTSKDAVKLDPAWGNNFYVLNTRLEVQPKDAFIAQILRAIH